MDFVDYIDHCKTKIRQAKPSASEEVISWNAPFILTPSTPSEKGILLIHGLLDSCFIMREIGQAFQERGYIVYAILLPGHGTTPKDLLYVSNQDWLKAVAFGIRALKQEATEVSIAGFSLGAALALQYTAEHPEENIQKIYGFSPACKIKSKLACLASIPAWIGKFLPRLDFLKIYDEDDDVKYKTMTFNVAWQVYKLTKKMKALRLSTPIFFAISEQDETVSFKGALAFFKRQKNTGNRMLVFSNRDYPTEENILGIRSDFPEKHILCFSHHSLTCSPANPHYGEHGAYTLKNIKDYQSDYYGNVLTFKILKDGKRVSRLFYNPVFQRFIETMFSDSL